MGREVGRGKRRKRSSRGGRGGDRFILREKMWFRRESRRGGERSSGGGRRSGVPRTDGSGAGPAQRLGLRELFVFGGVRVLSLGRVGRSREGQGDRFDYYCGGRVFVFFLCCIKYE